MNLSDHDLVKQYVRGKHSSIEILINRHKDRVYTYIYMIVKNHDLTDDLFQDTFIKVVRSLRTGKYQDNGKFLGWVLRIAHNLIIDHYRLEKKRNTFSKDDYEVDLFNSSKFSEETYEDELVRKQVYCQVKDVLHELPEDQREVVELRHYKGLSFKEIADHTDVSINTALGRMRYALINMRRIIEEKNLNLVY